ncbi:MAG: amylo-alpha-1,6-glucosidase, partial [Candidatus Bathyarchaeota archaeon]|nr:amylo-alpha-1,6-glucosidase [Candidatus Bathyarchaeota archaeon]
NLDLPKINIQPNILSNLEKAIQMEWVVTNSLGGYASSTILGINTRKYHGLLVAAFNPPTDRRVLLAKLDEEIEVENKKYSLGSNEFRHGIQPCGYQYLSGFTLDPFPTYRYNAHGICLSKSIFMPHEKNATVVLYDILNSNENEVLIHISPLVNSRHFHSLTSRNELTWDFNQETSEGIVIVQPSTQLSTLLLFSSDGQYTANEGEWIGEVCFRVDRARGDSYLDDVFRPGQFEINLAPREKKKFYFLAAAGKSFSEAKNAFSSVHNKSLRIEDLYQSELNRQQGLLTRFRDRYYDIVMKDWLKWLILGADSFIVKRLSTQTKSVIAGYHWFEDWGRDSLISLPGLTLVTGRFEDAKEILLTFKQYCRKGIIPNRFPDHAGDKPDYNTVDATLWYINAVLQFLKYTGDFDFVKEQLWGTLHSIIEHHIQGTLYNIHMAQDGLIVHGPQLTWMDAMIGDHIVTQRVGRAVEIQALWYNALRTMELLATRFNQREDAKKYTILSEKVKGSFIESFWHKKKGYLFDVINDDVRDASLRPNQIIAASLDYSILNEEKRAKVVEVVWKKLFGVYGLRTISIDDPRYIGKYLGDWNHRSKAYHNGTVWPWLLGHFITAFLKVKNLEEKWRAFAFQNFLRPLFHNEIFRAGLGTISEIFDGDAPHTSRGCIAQAWSVAEPLRTYVEDIMLKRPTYEIQIFDKLRS